MGKWRSLTNKPRGLRTASGPNADQFLTPSPPLRLHKLRRRRFRIAMVILIACAAVVVCVLTAMRWVDHVSTAMTPVRDTILADSDLMAALSENASATDWDMLLVITDESEQVESSASTIAVLHVAGDGSGSWLLGFGSTMVADVDHGRVVLSAVSTPPAVAIETVSEITGLTIEHYANVDVDALSLVLGKERMLPTALKDGSVVSSDLRGYLRAGDAEDVSADRVARLHELLCLVASASSPELDAFGSLSFIDSLPDWLRTDLEASQLGDLRQLLDKQPLLDGRSAVAPSTPQDGRYVVDRDEVERLVEAMLAGEKFPVLVSPEAAVIPANVTVTVLNGAGLEGVASEAAGLLQSTGYQVEIVGNTNQFVYSDTLVVHDGQVAVANRVLGDLPVGRRVSSRGMYAFSTDILVIVGKDWP